MATVLIALSGVAVFVVFYQSCAGAVIEKVKCTYHLNESRKWVS